MYNHSTGGASRRSGYPPVAFLSGFSSFLKRLGSKNVVIDAMPGACEAYCSLGCDSVMSYVAFAKEWGRGNCVMLSEALALMRFDRDLQVVMLRAIGVIERQVAFPEPKARVHAGPVSYSVVSLAA